MSLDALDLGVLVAFYSCIVVFSLWVSRKERNSEDYFLASRSLIWPVIGISIVTANLSTEQFVGMAGQGAGDVGLAVSAWQLTSCIAIVIIAFTLLPRFLRAGIYTMPEFLEYRYDSGPPRRFNGGTGSRPTSGARLMPQFPVITVVTPWLNLGVMPGVDMTARSSWVWAS